MPVERYSKENTEVETKTKRSSLRKTECPRLSRRNQAMGAKVLFGPPAEEPIKRQPKLSNGHGPWVMRNPRMRRIMALLACICNASDLLGIHVGICRGGGRIKLQKKV